MKWDRDTDSYLVHMYQAGRPVRDIARVLSVTRAVIIGRAYRLGCIHGLKQSKAQRKVLSASRRADDLAGYHRNKELRASMVAQPSRPPLPLARCPSRLRFPPVAQTSEPTPGCVATDAAQPAFSILSQR